LIIRILEKKEKEDIK